MAAEIVVVTWNLQRKDPGRLDLADALRELSPDVLLLQEAPGDRIGPALAEPFQTFLWWPDAGETPGIVIAARLAHYGSGVVATEGAGAADRSRMGWARLRVGSVTLTVASAHIAAPPWPGTHGRRRAQRRVLSEWSAARVAEGDRVVVGGDFNTIDPSLDGMVDACAADPRPTWRPIAAGWMPPVLRLDAIFASPGLAISGRTDDRWRRSDHCPVVARVALDG